VTPDLKPFRLLGDERGSLIAIEAHTDVPFSIARIYYIFGTKAGVARGCHAHKSLQQVVVAVSGSCTLMLDDGHLQREMVLDDPAHGVWIGSMVWRELKHFSPDCVLLVLADQAYDEADYIRDYTAFTEAIAAREAHSDPSGQ
jgi:dTDP-4-dehydrorhamnose 3,5-epimerase-like enzyme